MEVEDQLPKEESKLKQDKSVYMPKIKQYECLTSDCIIFDNNTSYKCKLFLETDYNIYIYGDLNKPFYFNSEFYSFPLLYILSCNNISNFIGCKKNYKKIILKDYRNFIIELPPKADERFNNIIETFALPLRNVHYFNYAYSFYQAERDKSNLKIYEFNKEFKRQNINFLAKKYKILDNSHFQICPTYPKKLIVPYDMSQEQLLASANFRTKNRMPTLTYNYKYKDYEVGIWRSSQAKSGFFSSNKNDILLMEKIADNKKLFIYDARPYINAYSNKLKGAGTEIVKDYPKINLELIFCGISNIHAVRNSFENIRKNVSLIKSSESTNFTNIQSSGWYEAIITILKSSFQIYNSVHDGNNVLIHCSDGWDRTSQLCSLAQLLLDGYYRTLDGFICLIEKDWISFGHQFRYRSGFFSPFDASSKGSKLDKVSIYFCNGLIQYTS